MPNRNGEQLGVKAKKQIWVFGGIQKDNNTIVQERDKDTLLPLIKKFNLPGTKIITYGWKAYDNLEQEGYIHCIVNHSIGIISNDHPEIFMQKIRRSWKSLKK